MRVCAHDLSPATWHPAALAATPRWLALPQIDLAATHQWLMRQESAAEGLWFTGDRNLRLCCRPRPEGPAFSTQPRAPVLVLTHQVGAYARDWGVKSCASAREYMLPHVILDWGSNTLTLVRRSLCFSRGFLRRKL